MRCLVTGGAGFIGSHLVDRLAADGRAVSVVDNLCHGREEHLAAVRGEISLHVRDITEPGLSDLMREVRPEVIFHLAAQIDVRASVADPVDDARVNVLGTVNLADAAVRAGVRKICFATSAAVYGTPDTLPVSESAPLAPQSPYAAAKLSGETYLNMFRELHGLDCTHLALANVYGPRQDPHGEAGVIAIFTNALLSGAPTMIYGDGNNTRDYVYVDDVVSAFLAAAGNRDEGRRYNIGTGIQTTNRELHTVAAGAAGVQDPPEFAPPRPGEVRSSALDAARVGRDLGWHPRTALPDGLRYTVTHHASLG
jgi:UDP-glucose 4-epimerase